MKNGNQEILFVIAVGGVIAILLIGFIITILFFYQRKQLKQAIQQRLQEEQQRLQENQIRQQEDQLRLQEDNIRQIKENYEKELTSSQMEMQETTMKSIGKELHDNIKHKILVLVRALDDLPIKNNSPMAQKIKETRIELNNIIEEIKELSHSLQTDRIGYIGLLETIDAEMAKFKRIKSIQLKYESNLKINYFDGQKSTFLFRMLQEILQNVLKHSLAKEVLVKMYHDNEEMFYIYVEDNGKGFDIDNNRPSGIGLSNIFNRAKIIGATVTIKSEIGKGTSIQLALPIPPEVVILQ